MEDTAVMVSETSGPPAGWYPHPTMSGTQRYWDGKTWTDHIAPGIQPAPVVPAQSDHGGLIAAGIVTAIFIPFVGFIIGIVLMAKDKVGPGLGCMVISFISFLVWYDQLTQPSLSGY